MKFHKNTINLFIRFKIYPVIAKLKGIKDVTIICNNCIGGILYKSFGLKFNSPFINLFINSEDFIKICLSLEDYINSDLVFIDTSENYPVAMLKDAKIHFMHYHSKEEAALKWEERKRRVNYSELFFIFVQRDDCTIDDLKTFNSLTYKNKIALTYKRYNQFENTQYIKGFEETKKVDVIQWNGYFLGKKAIDQFNFLNWFVKGL